MVQRICVISPHETLTTRFNRIIKETKDEIGVYTAVLEEAVILCESLMKNGAEVFISRGGNKKYIEEKLGVPVVDISYQLSDYMTAFQKAKNIKGKVAIFSYSKKIDDLDTVGKLLEIDIYHYIFNDIKECRTIVKKAKDQGVVLGIGGFLTGSIARELGLEYISIESSKDSIMRSIINAKQLLQVKEEERRKNEHYRFQMEQYMTILNFTHDAIIAVDENNLVNVVNPMAEKLLRLNKKDIIGKPIYRIFPDKRFTNIIEKGGKEINRLTRIENTLISYNSIPIIINGQRKGLVATIKDVNKIQKDEHDIRIKLYDKGLITKYNFSDLIGNSQIMKKTIDIAKVYAKTSSTILIYGETGTGKEIFAQSIHNYSERKDEPFVAINCAALPESLLEAELFGYEEGAFTGALKKGKIGLFELAHRGTIFLDEIGEIPLGFQTQLLRVLQEKEIRRIGSNRVLPIDVRIIAATNKNLYQEVINGNFREDLYYRLNVLKLDIPPLRERKEDMEAIGEGFLKKIDLESYEKNKKFWSNIFEKLMEYPWYGNIREFQNILQRLYVLFKENLLNPSKIDNLLKEMLGEGLLKSSSKSEKEKHEKEQILNALRNNKWSKTKTAEELKISRTTLWRKIKEYGIEC